MGVGEIEREREREQGVGVAIKPRDHTWLGTCGVLLELCVVNLEGLLRNYKGFT